MIIKKLDKLISQKNVVCQSFRYKHRLGPQFHDKTNLLDFLMILICAH